MISDAELAALRTEQGHWLLSEGTISRPDAGPPTFDEESGLYVPAAAAVFYSGPLRVMSLTRSETEVVGELDVTVQRYVGTAPWDAGDVHINDIVLLSISTDLNLVGRPLIVRSVDYSSIESARRFTLEEHQQ